MSLRQLCNLKLIYWRRVLPSLAKGLEFFFLTTRNIIATTYDAINRLEKEETDPIYYYYY